MTTTIGVDIGGANIKISDGTDGASISFPLWKYPDKLNETLQELFLRYPAATTIAVTMTGELADCFTTKNQGVRFILDAVQRSAGKKEVLVWQTGGEFLTLEEAFEFPMLVAAANWHALATWAGRMAPQGDSLLIDIGSTTTDIIPIQDGYPIPTGLTDFERLQSQELLYLGAKRTPLCALAKQVRIDDIDYPLANEFFATTYDIGLLTGHIQEDASCHNTSNGKPATSVEAQIRLARQFCCDTEELSPDFLLQAAHLLLQEEVEMIAQGIKHVRSAFESESGSNVLTILTSGEGEFLASLALSKVLETASGSPIYSFSKFGSAQLSTAACAYALSVLASERHLKDITIEMGLG